MQKNGKRTSKLATSTQASLFKMNMKACETGSQLVLEVKKKIKEASDAVVPVTEAEPASR